MLTKKLPNINQKLAEKKNKGKIKGKKLKEKLGLVEMFLIQK